MLGPRAAFSTMLSRFGVALRRSGPAALRSPSFARTCTARSSYLARMQNRARAPTCTHLRPGGDVYSSVLSPVFRVSGVASTRHCSTSASASTPATAYLTEDIGEPGTPSFRVYVHECERGVPLSHATRLSPWFDVPLRPDPSARDVFSFVVEIPKGTNAKMEAALDEEFHPIKQDKNKDGSLSAETGSRYIKHGDKLFNYGFLPQTWEDPRVSTYDDDGTGYPGDGDPIDAVELGETVAAMGEIKKVKVVGALALLDEREMDWKVLVVDVNHPAANLIQAVEDIEEHFPGAMEAVRTWYKVYKVADGKAENSYAFGGKVLDKNRSLEAVEECHKLWRALETDFEEAAQ